MLENHMVMGEMEMEPDETMTCPHCGKVWDRVRDTWEAEGANSTEKRPVSGNRCRACALEEALGDEKTLLAFAKAYRLDSKAMKYAMVSIDTNAINDWIWDDAAKLIRESNPALLAVCVSEYIEDNDYLKCELTDFVMGGWQ